MVSTHCSDSAIALAVITTGAALLTSRAVLTLQQPTRSAHRSALSATVKPALQMITGTIQWGAASMRLLLRRALLYLCAVMMLAGNTIAVTSARVPGEAIDCSSLSDEQLTRIQDYYRQVENLGYDVCATDVECEAGTFDELTLEQKIAQTFIVGFDASAKDSMGASVNKYGFGGVFINGKPDSSMDKAFFEDMGKDLRSQLLVAADDEGGQIIRFQKNAFPFTLPTAKVMGSWDDSKIVSETTTLATHLKEQGVNLVLAPVLDLDSNNTNNAISKYDRAFSSSQAVVTTKAGAFAHTLADTGLGTSLKHFPGIARTTSNTDDTYQVVNATIAELSNDVAPFSSLDDTKNTTIMLSNMVLSGWGNSPVSLNSEAVQYIRKTLQFEGVIITDDIGVFARYNQNPITLKDAIVRALNAGVSMPLFTYPGDAEMDEIIKEVVANVDEEKINTALTQAISYKTSLGLRTTTTSTPGGDPTGDNMGDIYNFGINQLGLQPYQSAGLAGNIQAESGGNPTAVNPTSGAYGIVQWMGGRLSALKAKPGYDTVPVQLDFMKEEMEGSYKAAVYDPLKASKDIGEATAVVLYKYEIPCFPWEPECMVEYAKRLGHAEELLKKYGNGAPSSGGGSGCQSTGSAEIGDISSPDTECAPGTTFDSIVKTRYTGSQVDEPYPTIRLCAVDSMGGILVNAGVSGPFARIGQEAQADGVELTGSGFRLADSCGGSGTGGNCAQPGKSNHQIGLAIDFNIPGHYVEGATCTSNRQTANTPMYQWLDANAFTVGGAKQYAPEAWHWDITIRGGESNLRCE